MNDKSIVLAFFIVVYLYLILFKHYRAVAIWTGITGIFLFGIIEPLNLIAFVNWNVIGIFAGTLIIAEFFTYSRVPAFLADFLVGRSKNIGTAMLRVCIMSGFLSIFVENVAVVLIVAPIALEMAKKLKVSPIPVIIGIAVASNLQGTATLIGDPPSMILAGFLRMDFNDFFVYYGRPGIFFAVEFSAIVSFIVLYLFFRSFKQPVGEITRVRVLSWTPTLMLCAMIAGLAVAPVFDREFLWLSGTVCMVAAIAAAAWSMRKFGGEITFGNLKKYDFDTTLFLAGIFVLVHTFEDVGLVESMSRYLVELLGSGLLVNYLFIVLFSVIVSAVIDNVPFITIMIPVTYQLGRSLTGGEGSEYLLVFGLLIGTCMGGNITPIGAAANIVSVGILRKEGYRISFWTFVKIGLPYTIAATAAGALFIWLVWK
ncbi:SLC13 family permease [candidate division KSB1 bacterium]